MKKLILILIFILCFTGCTGNRDDSAIMAKLNEIKNQEVEHQEALNVRLKKINDEFTTRDDRLVKIENRLTTIEKGKVEPVKPGVVPPKVSLPSKALLLAEKRGQEIDQDRTVLANEVAKYSQALQEQAEYEQKLRKKVCPDVRKSIEKPPEMPMIPPLLMPPPPKKKNPAFAVADALWKRQKDILILRQAEFKAAQERLERIWEKRLKEQNSEWASDVRIAKGEVFARKRCLTPEGMAKVVEEMTDLKIRLADRKLWFDDNNNLLWAAFEAHLRASFPGWEPPFEDFSKKAKL